MSASMPIRGSNLYTAEHEGFRDTVKRFLEREVLPDHAQWEQQGLVPREIWRSAGQAGLLLPMAPVDYGGSGGDFLFTAIVVDAPVNTVTFCESAAVSVGVELNRST